MHIDKIESPTIKPTISHEFCFNIAVFAVRCRVFGIGSTAAAGFFETKSGSIFAATAH